MDGDDDLSGLGDLGTGPANSYNSATDLWNSFQQQYPEHAQTLQASGLATSSTPPPVAPQGSPTDPANQIVKPAPAWQDFLKGWSGHTALTQSEAERAARSVQDTTPKGKSNLSGSAGTILSAASGAGGLSSL